MSEDRKPTGPREPAAASNSPYVRAFLDWCIEERRRQLTGEAERERER